MPGNMDKVKDHIYEHKGKYAGAAVAGIDESSDKSNRFFSTKIRR